MGSSRRIEKCPQSGWGCMGGGATDHHLEGNHYPVQLYCNINQHQHQHNTTHIKKLMQISKLEQHNMMGYGMVYVLVMKIMNIL